jgi:hypothetical protein
MTVSVGLLRIEIQFPINVQKEYGSDVKFWKNYIQANNIFFKQEVPAKRKISMLFYGFGYCCKVKNPKDNW